MTLEFRCADVGVVCKASIRAETAEQLIEKVASHAADRHGVPELSRTLVDYAVTTVKSAE